MDEGDEGFWFEVGWELWSRGEGKELVRVGGDNGLLDCIGDVLKASAREEVGGVTVGRVLWLIGLAAESKAMVVKLDGLDVNVGGLVNHS